MSILTVLKEIAVREDMDSAKVVTALLNTDRFVIGMNEGRREFTPEDVMRLGRIVNEYHAAPLDGVAAFAPQRPKAPVREPAREEAAG